MTERSALCRIGVGLLLASSALVSAQQVQLPSEPARQFGASITGAFEGWFRNPDGSYTFLVGYLNRNRAEEENVPIGPNNRIEPGGPDLGQPTHFLPGRQTGMFTVTVPKEFTPQQRLTWTITLNGQTNSIPLRLHPDYIVSPFSDLAVKNTPPVLRFSEGGEAIQGPIALLSKPGLSRTTSLAMPLLLPLWAEDDAKYSSGTNAPMRNPPPPVQLTWSQYRGPGTVVFTKAKPQVERLAGGGVNEPFRGKAETSAKFSEPGEYILHVTANDYSGEGGGGEVCCWTTALVKVLVTN
jgi:hypothetical protein